MFLIFHYVIFYVKSFLASVWDMKEVDITRYDLDIDDNQLQNCGTSFY